MLPRRDPGGNPQGPVAIESLTHGDQILTVDEKGSPVQSPVEGIFVSKNTLWRIETDHGPLVATREHPVALWDGGFRWVGLLQPGDIIRHWEDGRFQKSTVQHTAILTQEALVLNLQVGEPHTFLAEGVLVHNKAVAASPQEHRSELPLEMCPSKHSPPAMTCWLWIRREMS